MLSSCIRCVSDCVCVCAFCAQPPVKEFVKQPGGLDLYACTLKYLPGHNPDLVLHSDSGDEAERVDLTQYKSVDALHQLFADKGIPKKPEASAGHAAATGGVASHSEL